VDRYSFSNLRNSVRMISLICLSDRWVRLKITNNTLVWECSVSTGQQDLTVFLRIADDMVGTTSCHHRNALGSEQS